MISIYLVQILINLYRYNTRVAAHYLAQADVLILKDLNVDDFTAAHKALWPDLDYGKMPRSPTESLVRQMWERYGPHQKKDGEKTDG